MVRKVEGRKYTPPASPYFMNANEAFHACREEVR
jgi:hypothetical protein